MSAIAKKWNLQYSNNNSFFVDLKDRLNNTINSFVFTKQKSIQAAINVACDRFIKLHPTKKKFEDLDLCEAIMLPLSDILIDVTMQRMLDLNWVLYIIGHFRDVQAQPIQVYKVLGNHNSISYYPAGKGGLYASWDAQHTAMALYILCVYVFKQDPSKVLVPVVIYKVSKKADIRENFVSGNTKAGKKLLDAIDVYMQQVFGVRVDGSTNPEWVETEKKQRHLENADLFVTHEKFGNINEAGAISRMQEIDHYNSEIIRKFTLYASTVMPESGRPIASQEIEIMCAWFDMCKGLDYSDEEIVDLSTHLNELFNADFHAESEFWEKARIAYKNWWDKYWDGVDDEYRPEHMSFSKSWRNGGTFIYHQLKKTWKGRLPELTINTPFKPAAKDLYNV
jgi:hypothetical protein